MKGFKAAIVAIVATAFICFVIIFISRFQTTMGLKVIDDGENIEPETIVKEEGVFPKDVNYVYAEGRDIFHIKYDIRDSVKVYDLQSNMSEVVLTPINKDYKICDFFKSGDYYIWEEEMGFCDESEESGVSYMGWAIYFRVGNEIVKVDEYKYDGSKDKDTLKIFNSNLSAYGSNLVYKSYDSIPGTDGKGLTIKLYDLSSRRSKIIFSLSDAEDIMVSDPYIYKNYVVWSTYRYSNDNIPIGDIYVYSMKSNGYTILTRDDGYIGPMIYENYIACGFYTKKGPSLVLINMNTGDKKIITSSDYSLSPKLEMHDYMMGNGYITWNDSYAESVDVYDISEDRIYRLKKAENSSKSSNSLLNVKIYDKMVLFIDHVFNNRNGTSISETNRYFILK